MAFARVAYCVAWVLLFPAVCCAEAPPPINKVDIDGRRAFQVNGRPFFPIMAWLQDAENFAAVKDCGMNTTAGYWPTSSGTKDVAEYLALVQNAGLYGIMPFDAKLAGHPSLLAYIHGDEPDLPHQVSDADVVPAPTLRINRSTPLWKLLDGVSHSWSVLEPLDKAVVTIRLKQPVTVESVAVWPTISAGLAVAKEVSFEAGGQEILRATLESKKGQQKFRLAKPATFQELKLTVLSTYPGEQTWGSIGEIEGFDADGKNVLLSPPRYEPRASPAQTLEEYRAIKAADPTKPVFMTLTGHFHPHFKHWSDQQRTSLYPEYLEATDVVGYDIYPIYGWNKPEWIHLVYDATRLLAEKAGSKPVYAWIETSKGGQWTGPLERQKDVTPAHIRAETWMAICGGATSIGYFTHVWKPSYHQFGVPAENRKALREINQQITRLAPAILGPEPEQSVTFGAADKTKLAAIAREHDGSLYIFAVNYDERQVEAKATFVVESLAAETEIVAIDEDRTIRAQTGAFTDTFAPLAVHLYRIAQKKQ